MPANNPVLIRHFCLHHQVEMSFIDSLQEYGLISVQVINEDKYVAPEDLKTIEKIVEYYYDLGINLEGIEVIFNLLMQNETLRKKLEIAQRKLNLLDAESEL